MFGIANERAELTGCDRNRVPGRERGRRLVLAPRRCLLERRHRDREVPPAPPSITREDGRAVKYCKLECRCEDHCDHFALLLRSEGLPFVRNHDAHFPFTKPSYELPATWARIDQVRRDECVRRHDLGSRSPRNYGLCLWIRNQQRVSNGAIYGRAEPHDAWPVQLSPLKTEVSSCFAGKHPHRLGGHVRAAAGPPAYEPNRILPRRWSDDRWETVFHRRGCAPGPRIRGFARRERSGHRDSQQAEHSA